MRWVSLVAFLSLVLLPSQADARRRVVVVEEDDEEEPPPKIVTVGVMPIELIGPFYEAEVEVRLPAKFGASFIAGYGTPALISDLGHEKFYELAGQLRYYVGGSFEGGIHVGGEVMYLGGPKTVDATPAGATLSAGGFVGFKYVVGGGFTIDSEIGIRGLAVRQQPEGIESRGKDTQLLGRFILGWTF